MAATWLLGAALAATWVPARAGDAPAPGRSGPIAPDAEIRVPDLPAAAVTITPTDLDHAVTGVGLPAPTAFQVGTPVATPPDPPSSAWVIDDEIRTGSLLPSSASTPSASIVQPLVRSAPPMPEAPAQSPTAGSTPAAAPPALPAPPSAPVVAPPATAAAIPLDPEVLHRALDAFVGSEPMAPVAGRPPTPEQLRFRERQDIAAAYAARGYAPLWVEDGRFNAPARSLLSRIDHAAEDGLDLRATPVAVPHGGDADVLVASELGLTQAVVAYGKQASGGRVDPSRIAPLIDVKPEVPDAARVISAVTGVSDPGEALRGFNPPHKGYVALRAKLAELRQKTELAGQTPIPYGPILKPGMRDARVPLIRARFGLDIPPSDATDSVLVYDTRVAAAVADFQKAHHLPPSGVLTIRTIAALSGGNPRRLENEIVANMERWRWLPRDLGQDHLEVNIPNYTLDVLHADDVVHHTRVVVGQPDKPTPVFSETMKFIIVNPYWNVPLSIVKKEMMPKLAADPDYFANHGYETVERNGITYVRQPPGEANALGRIKFMFPNKYSVYLHDTNARALFGKEQRALSHGCVRVEAPFRLAEVVLGPKSGWSEARIKKLVGGDERTITLPQPLPLHIVYFTAFVDDKGGLQLRDDVYGYSAKLRAALGLDT